MFAKILKQQKELQNELDKTTKKISMLAKDLNELEGAGLLEHRIKAIENILREFDTTYLNNLNKKITALLGLKKTLKILIVIFVFFAIIYSSIFLPPWSPICQKTRRQKILNDILEKHFTELCAKNDAIKAIEQCKEILENWERSRETAKEEAHE